MQMLKNSVLCLLENARGGYLSGQFMADRLNVSRNAVWKCISRLKKDGYIISSVTNKGYKLEEKSDVLSKDGIMKYIDKDKLSDFGQIHFFDAVDSTNNIAREAAASGCSEGFFAVAEKQNAGRGRRGRSFISPKGSGVYMSVVVRPEFSFEESVKLTCLAAAAASECIEEVSGEPVGIKWVNDLYMNGRKICGILSEGALSVENGRFDFAVVGVGINVTDPPGGFPPEIAKKAGSVFGGKNPGGDIRCRIAGGFYNRFFDYYNNYRDGKFMDSYRSRLFFLGKKIRVIGALGEYAATALDVNRSGELKVRLENGEQRSLSSGEISIDVAGKEDENEN